MTFLYNSAILKAGLLFFLALVVVVPLAGLLHFSLLVCSISENKQRRAELSLSEPKGRLGKDLETFKETGKTQSTTSAAVSTSGSSAALRWIINKGKHQQAGEATVTTAVARVRAGRTQPKKQKPAPLAREIGKVESRTLQKKRHQLGVKTKPCYSTSR